MEGKTIIELTDIHTGKVERHEDHNMVTNALKYYFANFGQLNPTALESFTDYITPLLGGVLLLDTSLTENADHVLLEGGIKMTGAGINGVVNSGNPTERGSYNEIESGWNDNVFTQVWDFNTSQANGRIACVCLTSDVHAYIGEGNNTSQVQGTTSSAYTPTNYKGNALTKTYLANPLMLVNVKNNKVKYITLAGSQLADGIKISEEYLGITEFYLRSHRAVPVKASSDVTILFPFSVPTNYTIYEVGHSGDSLYFALGRYNTTTYTSQILINSSNPLYICRLDDNNTITLVATLTASMLGFTEDRYMRTSYYNDILHYNNGSIVLSTVDGTNIYNDNTVMGDYLKIGLSNLDITQITKYVSDLPLIRYGNNSIWCDSDNALFSAVYKIDLVDNAIYPISHSANSPGLKTCYVRNPLGILYTNQIWRNPMYLATINNLDEAVTKDGTKTMKVIYQLVF